MSARGNGSKNPGLWAVCALIIAAAMPAHAVPRYAARYQQNCSLCHHDPSGGGMRSTYAAQYLVPAELARYRLPAEELERLDPAVGKNLTVGFDLRTIHHYDDDGRTPGNFLQMQGDVYLAFQLDERFAAYFDRGMSGSYEVFGTAHILPAGGYLRAGRFSPPYGWRLADHTAFVRAAQGFGPPGHTDVGLEAGASPGAWDFQAAVLNGAPGSTRDNNRGVAGVVRASVRLRLPGAAACAGGSLWRNDARGAAATLMGPFWSLDLGPVTWVGEVGWLRSDRPLGGNVTRWTFSNELAVSVARGIDLLGTYDFTDPDIDRLTGASERVGAGCEVLAYPFLHLRLACNWLNEEGAGADAEDYLQTEVQVHLLY